MACGFRFLQANVARTRSGTIRHFDFPDRGLDRCQVQSLLDSFEALFEVVNAVVDDRHVDVNLGDLRIEGTQPPLDENVIILQLPDVAAYGSQVLQDQVFGAFGHGGSLAADILAPHTVIHGRGCARARVRRQRFDAHAKHQCPDVTPPGMDALPGGVTSEH